MNNFARDRWILEQLEHNIAPILRKLKGNMLVKISKRLKKIIDELEEAITQMILDERKRTRNGD